MNLLMAIGTEKDDVAHRVFAALRAWYVAVKARGQAAVSANLARQFDEVASTHPQRLRAFIAGTKIFLAPSLCLVVGQAKPFSFVGARTSLHRAYLGDCRCTAAHKMTRPAAFGVLMSGMADTLPAVCAESRIRPFSAAGRAVLGFWDDAYAATRTWLSRPQDTFVFLIVPGAEALRDLKIHATLFRARKVSKEGRVFGHTITPSKNRLAVLTVV